MEASTSQNGRFFAILGTTIGDEKIALFKGREFLKKDSLLRGDFYRIYVPNLLSTVVWAIAIPVQTAILGHISSDALAANNIASTFYQYATFFKIVEIKKTYRASHGVAVKDVFQTGRNLAYDLFHENI